ncbi:hypothetical protein Droror1_Dr00005005 [Drosera rotundifolia]
MEKTTDSSTTDPTPSTTTATTIVTGGDNARDHHNNNPLRHLHRFSHKISKPSHSTFDSHPLHHQTHHHHHPPQQQQQNQQNQFQQNQPNQNQQNQQNNTNNQPPVYNINKNDFRDVVQKLTGAPPHNISSPPPPPPPQQVPIIQAPKPPSSRLQRIRPPPLSQISNRPPPLLGGPSFPTPSSPLPPLPSCHAAAESPITAYMRFLHGSVSAGENSSGFPSLGVLNSPKLNDLGVGSGGEQMGSQQQGLVPPFGCFPSPRSPGTLFSPTGSGQFVFPQLPVSPRIPAVPSPK